MIFSNTFKIKMLLILKSIAKKCNEKRRRRWLLQNVRRNFTCAFSVACLFNNLIVNPKSKFLHVHNYIVLRAFYCKKYLFLLTYNHLLTLFVTEFKMGAFSLLCRKSRVCQVLKCTLHTIARARARKFLFT